MAMKKGGVSAHRFGKQEIAASGRLSPAMDFKSVQA
jgi:hypothetical protein